MKEMVATILAITLIAVAIMSIPALATTQREYMKVTATQRQDGTVEVTDANGNIFAFKGYGFNEGEIVLVDMYDNQTETVYDDQILNVTKLK